VIAWNFNQVRTCFLFTSGHAAKRCSSSCAGCAIRHGLGIAYEPTLVKFRHPLLRDNGNRMGYKGAPDLNHTLLRGISLLLSSFCRNAGRSSEAEF
jgi:hypothetical protein